MGPLPPATADRIRKLILVMLSSDKDGEVMNAAQLIRRTLSQVGSDIHALSACVDGSGVEAGRANGARREQERRSQEERAQPDWHAMAKECQQHADQLDDRERAFIDDMVRWTLRREPSERQARWLHSIWCRVGRSR